MSNQPTLRASLMLILIDCGASAPNMGADAILELILSRLPEEKDTEFEKTLKVIGYHEQYCKGYNKALEQVRAILKGNHE